MSVVAWINYVDLLTKESVHTGYRYQDYSIGVSRSYDSQSYPFLAFDIVAGGGTTGGDKSTASFVVVKTLITTNLITQAVDESWRLRVRQVKINQTTGVDVSLFTDQLWLCNSYNQNENQPLIGLALGSPLNLVDGKVGRTLTSKMVGRLPKGNGIRIA
jgi:hypothetical protein